MKNDSLQCDKLLIQNNDEISNNNGNGSKDGNGLTEALNFLDSMEKDIDIQIKGLSDMRNKIEAFKARVGSGGQNIPIQQASNQSNNNAINSNTNNKTGKNNTNTNAMQMADNQNLLNQLMSLNKMNKNNNNGQFLDEGLNYNNAKGQGKVEDSGNFLELIKNENADANQSKGNDNKDSKVGLNLSLGEIEKQIAMLKSLSVKN
jgi:cell division septum initiation protein DivIVA